MRLILEIWRYMYSFLRKADYGWQPVAIVFQELHLISKIKKMLLQNKQYENPWRYIRNFRLIAFKTLHIWMILIIYIKLVLKAFQLLIAHLAAAIEMQCIERSMEKSYFLDLGLDYISITSYIRLIHVIIWYDPAGILLTHSVISVTRICHKATEQIIYWFL